jgi:hypothetical protein
VLEEAAGGRIEALIGSHDPLAAVQDALNLQGYDEVIISTLPPRVSRWLRLDLPHKVAALGVRGLRGDQGMNSGALSV